MAGLAMAAPRETLALTGGPKAVTFPTEQQTALFKWPRYGPAEKKTLHDLIDTGKFYEELPLFESEWKAYTRSPFVKAHMNCSSALTSMYFALDLEPGTEIMVPSYTFFSTCLAMRFFGYVPVFVDVDPNTACFDLEDARRKLTPRTKAMMVMHSWGLPCEMDRIAEYSRENGLILLEDAAQAHGAAMQGRMMGTWGAMGAYSFQLSKVMPTVEGGMGMYKTREYFERAAAFGHYEDPAKFAADSSVRQYEGTGFGQKYRMHPFAAAVARQHGDTILAPAERLRMPASVPSPSVPSGTGTRRLRATAACTTLRLRPTTGMVALARVSSMYACRMISDDMTPFENTSVSANSSPWYFSTVSIITG